ncbi:hypothetical protein [Streptomyces sp. SBT349]|uniref:hypothetical protein n=1 Tax=Streptomyces sp. SBT349 TaxID=1580539 RepID=UPI001F1B6B1D|nr:hypothetical protein [Streptomyces sp. SBT349]
MVLDGAVGRAESTCTFGLSANGVGGSSLVVHPDGKTESVEVEPEERGAQYRRRLDLVPTFLADPAQAGVAGTEAVRSIDIIEPLHQSA